MLTRETELSILYEISSISTRLRDVDGICDVALDKATRLLGAEVAVFYLRDSGTNELRARASRGLRLSKVRPSIPLTEPGLLSSGAQSHHAVEKVSFPTDILPGLYQVQSEIGLPIRADADLIGWLYMAWLHEHPIEASERTLHSILADRIGNALEIALARERDRKQQEALIIANQRLQLTLDQLTNAHEHQQSLIATIRELSTPSLVITEQIILMPLIGSIDKELSGQFTERLLEGVARQHARICIIDITGMSIVDAGVADTLLHAATAVRLLGAEAVVCGIRPDVAEMLVAIGVDLDVLSTASDLRGALRIAFRKLGKELVSIKHAT